MTQIADLRIPFSWEERRPVLLHKCLYLPSHYAGDAHLGPLSGADQNLFEQGQPLVVEYCSGNGQWVAEMAERESGFNWIAVEKDFERAKKIWRKAVRMNLGNLFVVCGEALEFTRLYLKEASLAGVWINFPDPWPKTRHAKHRLIQKEFVDELKRVLSPSAVLTVVTDDPAYCLQISKEFSLWKNLFDPAPYASDVEGYGTSYFHALWLEKQRTIRFHRFSHAESDPC